MAITKEQAIDILDKFDFFEGQRAGRELWNDKPYEVQEEDINNFSRDVAELKAYIADVVPKSEVERLENTYRRAIRKIDNKTITAIRNAKQEVAKEIFEEIEKYKRIIIEGVKPVYTLKQRELEELKKKYTEGEK